MDTAFIDGQAIVHALRSTYDGDPIMSDAWTGIYNSRSNTIEHQNVTYVSITAFAMAHEKAAGVWRHPMRCLDACYIKLDGIWVAVWDLPCPSPHDLKIDSQSPHPHQPSPSTIEHKTV
jgi:hypothetical protein